MFLYMEFNGNSLSPMKRILVIAMLMFTVLACSTGPSQAEFDALAEDVVNRGSILNPRIYENEQQIKELKQDQTVIEDVLIHHQNEINLLNDPKLADFIVTYKAILSSDDTKGQIDYLAGDETKTFIHLQTSQCWKDAVIGAPLPLSCR